jgi:hypothetical protein
VFEKGVLRRIFESKRDEIIGGWRKLRNEELQNLHSSPNIIRMIKSRRMRLAERVVSMGKEKNPYRILMAKPKGKRPLGISSYSWGIILKWIVDK